MKTLRRLIYNDVLASVAVVTLGFLALQFFMDFMDELNYVRDAEATGYRATSAMAYVALLLPSHLYELLPITVLIGTIVVMTRLAQTSEFTILRTSGLGPWRALRTLLGLGAVFVVITFATGDYIAPYCDRAAQLLKTRFQGRLTSTATGAWLRGKQAYTSYSVNVSTLTTDGHMGGIRIYEFDNQHRLVSVTQAPKGQFAEGGWTLLNATRSEFNSPQSGEASISRSQQAELHWPTEITGEMVQVAILKPERMATLDLFQYIRHLDANGQSAQRYEIEFWKKVFYPLSCLVMVVMALPFAYLHFRSGGIATYMFGGVMMGISFFFLNNVFGYIGNIQNWSPWITAAAPGMIYSVLSLTAFAWLVLRR